MTPLPVAAAVTAAAVAGLLYAEKRDAQALRWVCKPVASLAFVALAVALGASRSPYGRALLAALALCLAGDVLLIPRSPRAFLAGVGAFAAGHVAFLVAFALLGADPRLAGAALVPLAAASLTARQLLRPRVEAPLRPAVDGYVVVLTLVVAAAAATRVTALAVGALAFYLSDLSVALDRFVRPRFANRLWGLPLYYGAQLLLASTAGR